MHAHPESLAHVDTTDQSDAGAGGITHSVDASGVKAIEAKQAPTAQRPPISREEAIKLAMARTG